jgi:putative aldouronate transport system substrate-binding protein
MNKKVWFLVFLATLTFISAACSYRGENSADSFPHSSAYAAKNEAKPVLRSLQIWLENDYNTNPVAKLLEERTGYKVQYDMLPKDKPEDMLNLLIASGDHYDVMTIMGTSDFKALYANYAKIGALTDLGPLVDKYGPNIKASISQATLDTAKVDGKLYAIPTMAVSNAGRSLLIRQDWLDKLGLPAPATLDELVTVLKAFKEKDPGNNGDKTIPLTAKADDPFVQNIVGAFGMPNFYNDVNGKLTPRILDPGYKEYVMYMNDLFRQGLLDKEFGINKDATMKEKFISGKAGMIPLHYVELIPVANALKKNYPDAKLAYIPALKGKDGKMGISASAGLTYLTFIPKSAKHPEDAMKWINAKLDKETFKLMAIGEEGKHYTLKDGVYTPNLPIFTEERDQAINFFTGIDEKNYPTYWQVRVRKDRVHYDAWEFLNVKQPPETRIVDMLSASPFMPEYSKHYQQLNSMVVDYTIKLIYGIEPITGLEDFRRKFKKAGGDESFKEVNDWYATLKK